MLSVPSTTAFNAVTPSTVLVAILAVPLPILTEFTYESNPTLNVFAIPTPPCATNEATVVEDASVGSTVVRIPVISTASCNFIVPVPSTLSNKS